MSIPQSFLDELRARTSLSSLIQRSSVPLKKAGREWKACCPFHQEKSPSFTVNDEKGFYHCFGCHAHGDVIGWLINHDGMQFIDAVKTLAEMAGMEVPAPDPKAAERAKRRDGYVDIMAQAQKFFAGGLYDVAKDYLAKRGIGDSSIATFGIGFAPNSRAGQPSPLLKALGHVPAETLEQLGLVKRNPDTGVAYDFFRGRITIPIHDARGNVIGFGGRILGSGEPKYLNSPDTPVFDKGRTLFNLHRAAPAARAKGRLLIVEGYMDVIGLDAVGFDTAVAPNGTALTEHQLFLAWKLVDAPTVCFDGDKAGRKAAVRAAQRALSVLEPGKSLRFASPPEGKDPDDLARESGLDVVNAMVDAAVRLVDVIWRDMLEQFDMRDPDARSGMAAEIKRLLSTIRNADVRQAYADELRALFRGAGTRSANAQHKSRGRGRNVARAVESALVVGLIDVPNMLDHAEAIATLRWRDDDHARIVDTLVGIALESADLSKAAILSAIERAGLTEALGQIRQEAIALPFTQTTNPAQARDALMSALRENFS